MMFVNLFSSPTGDGNAMLVGLFGLTTLVCWIIYWVQLAQYKNKLKRALA
jgi:hypothetical protein